LIGNTMKGGHARHVSTIHSWIPLNTECNRYGVFIYDFHQHLSAIRIRTLKEFVMPADATIVPLRSDMGEAPAARREQPQRPLRERPEQPAREQPVQPVERSPKPERAPQSPRRRWVRRVSFGLLPLALIVGGYWYVIGGQVMSTDDAYVQAETVGISTDVSGFVENIASALLAPRLVACLDLSMPICSRMRQNRHEAGPQ
jgi:hypothetical protein